MGSYCIYAGIRRFHFRFPQWARIIPTVKTVAISAIPARVSINVIFSISIPPISFGGVDQDFVVFVPL